MSTTTTNSPDRPSARRLTDRELSILKGIAAGQTNQEIGRDLFLTENTVKAHQRHVFKKLGARSRAHAVDLAHRIGLLGPDSWRVVWREGDTEGCWMVSHAEAQQETYLTTDKSVAMAACLNLAALCRNGLPPAQVQRLREPRK